MLRSRDPGRVLLSRAAIGHSTIGAEGLNCVFERERVLHPRCGDRKVCRPDPILILDLRTGEISD